MIAKPNTISLVKGLPDTKHCKNPAESCFM